MSNMQNESEDNTNGIGVDDTNIELLGGDNITSTTSTDSTLQTASDKKGAGILLRTLHPGYKHFHLNPQPGDTVKVHYEAYLTNPIDLSPHSKPFDSSRQRDQPFCFEIGNKEVIEGWDIALPKMKLGQIAEITVPYLYAYGEDGYPPMIPPRTSLLFRIELLDFTTLTPSVQDDRGDADGNGNSEDDARNDDNKNSDSTNM